MLYSIVVLHFVIFALKCCFDIFWDLVLALCANDVMIRLSPDRLASGKMGVAITLAPNAMVWASKPDQKVGGGFGSTTISKSYVLGQPLCRNHIFWPTTALSRNGVNP